jgi:hypothetical protein
LAGVHQCPELKTRTFAVCHAELVNSKLSSFKVVFILQGDCFVDCPSRMSHQHQCYLIVALQPGNKTAKYGVVFVMLFSIDLLD